MPSVCGITLPTTYNAPISFGQARFVADNTLLATGYELSEDGRRLGIMAGYNRPTAIWETGNSSSTSRRPAHRIAAAANASSRSPRPIPGTSAALWLSHALGGPHASYSSLHGASLNGNGSSTKVLLPVVDKIREDVLDGLAGLYVDNLLARPFVRPGGRV
jgi:hypothetical protein